MKSESFINFGLNMPQRRRPSMQGIPAYEDAGLFKSRVAPFDLDLVPHMHRNARQDLVVRGLLRDVPLEVIFAGRRVRQVKPLEMQLCQMLSKGRSRAHGKNETLHVDDMRLPLRVEGAFRPKFSRDHDGCETRSFHFLVARWQMIDDHGNINVFGAQPAKRPLQTVLPSAPSLV